MSPGWSFSRCYKCGGFALVRRAEINVIKVDKAPPGERVLLPESGDQPAGNHLNTGTTELLNHLTLPRIRPSDLGFDEKTPKKSPPRFPEIFKDGDLAKRNSKFVHLGLCSATFLVGISGSYLVIGGNTSLKQVQETSAVERELRRTHTSTVDLIQGTKPLMTDYVQQSSMAPIKAETVKFEAARPEQGPKTLIVRATSKVVNIHNGPGINYPVIAKTTPKMRYAVADWSDRWFKVVFEDPKVSPTGQSEGWIQNNLVKIVSE
jgi:hypothetical protein